jgi:hypothetical protein
MFEKATRLKLTFMSSKGLISVEQLWDVPLTSPNGFNLDSIAQEAYASLKRFTEESFVAPVVKAGKTEAELRMEIIKHVIAVKLAERAERENRAAKVVERNRLIALLDKKKEAADEGLSIEEIQRKLEALD